MPEIVENVLAPRHCGCIIGMQPPQRKPVEIRPSGKQHDKQNGEQEARNGIADDDGARSPDIEWRAVGDRLLNAQRNGNQIGGERHPEPERDGDGQFFPDQCEDADIAEIALAEIEARVIPQHQEEAFVGRLVEPELLL